MDIYYIKNSFQDIINSQDYFINLHYLERYISIITKFKERNLVKKKYDGLHKHHIIPRCLSGTNENKNLVTLSPREHYIIHHLLWKAFPQSGLTFAFKSMTHGSKRYGSNKITSRVYEQLCLDNFFIQKGRKVSEETRRKLSESHKVENLSEETRKKLSDCNKGKKRSEESKLKMSESQKGRKHSEESKRKMSESSKNPSEETRRKISNSQKGRKQSEETKRKKSESTKGRKRSEESSRKTAEFHRGQKRSEESRRKMSESAKNRPKRPKRPKTIWVCNSSCSKLIQKEFLDEFLSNGFILGRKFD